MRPFVHKPAENEYILYSVGINYENDDGLDDIKDRDIVWCINA
ncbi:MAG: hypothetical protein WD873_00720 [Candidatus Hydrogenedentales bacterium]